MEYQGYVAVSERAIELWRTQILRSWQKSVEKWPDMIVQSSKGLQKAKDVDTTILATHGASGIWRFCQKEIKRQLKIPKDEVIIKCHTRRLVKKIGNVWWMEVWTRPSRR